MRSMHLEVRGRKLLLPASRSRAAATAWSGDPLHLREIMKKLYGDKSKPVPELPKSVTDAGRQPAEKEDSIDDENA